MFKIGDVVVAKMGCIARKVCGDHARGRGFDDLNSRNGYVQLSKKMQEEKDRLSLEHTPYCTTEALTSESSAIRKTPSPS